MRKALTQSPGCKVGIFLKHAYAHTHPQVNLLPHSLKGVDMVIYQTARALGLESSVRPITEFGYGRHKYTAAGRDKVKDVVVAGDLYEDQAPSSYWAHDRLRSRDIVWLNARDKKNQELALAYTMVSLRLRVVRLTGPNECFGSMATKWRTWKSTTLLLL